MPKIVYVKLANVTTLADGNLYSNCFGDRFRVKKDGEWFTCKSFAGKWNKQGIPVGQSVFSHMCLTHHIIQYVNVPVSTEDGNHVYKTVTRETAKAIGHLGNIKGARKMWVENDKPLPFGRLSRPQQINLFECWLTDGFIDCYNHGAGWVKDTSPTWASSNSYRKALVPCSIDWSQVHSDYISMRYNRKSNKMLIWNEWDTKSVEAEAYTSFKEGDMSIEVTRP